jgi:hypothetical protein
MGKVIQLMRGARPSPRHELAGATPHTIVSATPANFLWIAQLLRMWGNFYNGDCVTAEEAFKLAVTAKVFLTNAQAIAWAKKNGVLNGATLTQVLQIMQKAGFVLNGNTYNDGPYKSVNWTNTALLQNAIAQGPVKIGVAADQIENVIQTYGVGKNGWVMQGFTKDTNLDHCTSLCGYGTFGWLSQQLKVTLPAKVNPAGPAYAMFTWSSIGMIDQASVDAVTGEAWLRNPNTVTVAQKMAA